MLFKCNKHVKIGIQCYFVALIKTFRSEEQVLIDQRQNALQMQQARQNRYLMLFCCFD
jgi:hypothetical protein